MSLENGMYIVPGTRWMFSYDGKSLLCSDLRTGSIIGRLNPPSESLTLNEDSILSGSSNSPDEICLVVSLTDDEEYVGSNFIAH